MIIIPTGCNYKQIENKDDDFIVSENEAIKFIVNFEKQSNVDIIDPKEIERICKMFYDAGLKIEKRLHNRNK